MRIESKEQFELALNLFLETNKHENSKSGAKLNLGDGLSLHVSKNKIMNFHFIYCAHGSGNTLPIGKYPKVSFYEARLEADELKKELLEEKKNSAKVKFRKKIKEKPKNFDDNYSHEKDVKNLSTIFSAIINNFYKSIEYQEFEFNMAIYLLINFPEYGAKILRLQKDLVDCPPFLKIILEKYSDIFHSNIYTKKSLVANRYGELDIQDCIKIALDYINSVNSQNKYFSNYILPDLQDKSDKKIYDELNHYISTICPHIKIDLRNISDIFYKYSIHSSGFNEKFLNAVVKDNQIGARIFGHNDDFYYHQIKALRSWWHERLIENTKILL